MKAQTKLKFRQFKLRWMCKNQNQDMLLMKRYYSTFRLLYRRQLKYSYLGVVRLFHLLRKGNQVLFKILVKS